MLVIDGPGRMAGGPFLGLREPPMLRRAFATGAVLAGVLAVLPTGRGDEDPKTATQFLQGLRDRGYYDLAAEYLEELRNDPKVPADLRALTDYEQGRILLEEASKSGDLVRRKDLLDQARTKLAAFTEHNPKHPKRPEALVQLARLLVERGHLALLFSQEADEKEKAEKAAKLAEARASFDQARTEYAKAEEQLAAAFKTYPPFIPEGDPRKEQRDQVHSALMDSQLQKAVVDYEEGQTYEPKSKEREEYMSKGLAQFEELYKKYRTQWAGLTARMWQGKCYEERGEIGPALGIYKELLEHPDPRLRPLQKHVAYFKIIAEAKRGEHALAADDAARWHATFNGPNDRRSLEGLGVTVEWAKNILAQMDKASEAEKRAMIAKAVDLASEVVRVTSPHKPEALAILKKYKPNRAAAAAEIARLNYEDAMTQANEAIGEKDYVNAIACLKQAIRRADPLKDTDKANLARYQLAFSYLRNKQFYEAAVLCDHLARRYPRFSMAPNAAEVGIQSLADAYNTYTQIDHTADLDNLVALAEYTSATWPGTDQGDTALLLLGQINDGYGRYPKAIEAYEAVRPNSRKWVEAQTKSGSSHWMQSQVLREKNAAEADAEIGKAMDRLNKALKARRDSGAPPSDEGLIGNVCDIADVDLATGKGSEALALLDPVAKAQPAPVDTKPYKRLMATMLRAHVANSQVDQAMADMASLEKAGGGGAGMTRLYFELGKLLEKEMDALKAKGDTTRLAQTQSNYLKFLTAVANSKSGQSYDSLEWAGENMLKIGQPKEAADVLKGVLTTYEKDEAFLKQPESANRLLRTRLKLAAAFRDARDFTAADDLVAGLIKESPKTLETQWEKGMLLEAKALAKRGQWSAAQSQWQYLAKLLARSRTKPAEYYDAWWHVAFGYWKQGKATLAKQTLSSIMRLSPAVGGPEMKKKYQDLLAQIK
jgi:hypothetical protein